MRLEGGEHFDQTFEIFTQQGFAAGEATFLDTVCDGMTGTRLAARWSTLVTTSVVMGVL